MPEIIPGRAPARRDEDVTRRLDELRLQLLGAVDAARGAEAERAVVEARVRDLEHQHHMLEVERDELRREVERLTAARRGAPRRMAGRAVRVARRLLGNG